jgi:2-amino-4-hydroxy-6-hydroxymethyldihydropteridine diphosphokinase
MRSKTASSEAGTFEPPSGAEAEGGSLVALGLGSNRGDSRTILSSAAAKLSERLEGGRLSSLFESDPMYVQDQPRYLNAAFVGRFPGTPHELLDFIHEVEALFGRDRSRERRRGERTLDIDILLFGSSVVDEPPVLEIPHPGLRERKFALLPLLELLPEAVDPRNGESFDALLPILGDQGIYYADLAPYNRL